MFNDQNFSLRDFQEWLSNYNQNKKNQQNFGVQNIPARIFRKTIDLSTAGILQNTGIPFDGLHVEKIYVTATGASVDGSINIIFDRAMSDSQFNFKKLVENDSFTSGTSISKAFFSWAAQAGVSADIVFFNDIDYKAGSTKTSLIGTVTTNPANTTPTSIKFTPPTSRVDITTAAASTVIPAGKYGLVRCCFDSRSSSGELNVTIAGVAVFSGYGLEGNYGEYIAIAGETVTTTFNNSVDSRVIVELYTL